MTCGQKPTFFRLLLYIFNLFIIIVKRKKWAKWALSPQTLENTGFSWPNRGFKSGQKVGKWPFFRPKTLIGGIKIRPKSLSAHVFPGKAHFSKPKSGQKIEQFFTSKYGLRFGSLPARRDRRSCQEVCENGHPPRRFFAGLHTLSGRNSPLYSYADCSGASQNTSYSFCRYQSSTSTPISFSLCVQSQTSSEISIS